MIRRLRALAAVATIALAAMPAQAAGVASCAASTADVAFGTYNPQAAGAATAVGNVSVSCAMISGISLFVSYTIQLSKGSGSYTTRTMTSGANTLAYNLYTASNYATIWGDGSAGTSTVSDAYLLAVGTVVRNFAVYGRAPALQNVAAGNYGDTIIVTVTY